MTNLTCIRALLVAWGCCILAICGPVRQLPAADNAATTAGEKFWSFQPVRDVPVPAVRDPLWPQTTIDRFILSALERQDLKPNTPADRATLLRRATFDLTGLPPSPEELDAFVADRSPDAFAAVVERLLASPHYGERWGRHWLDVVRYADARDLIQLPAESDFREAWRYRDWVVRAFNQDLPYDRFVMQQVAGDLLQPADPRRIDADALVATGLLAIADFVPGDVDKQQMIADYVNDQIDVVGRAFLGLTLACARCHDHKFDPITIEDYYSLAGIFFSTRLVPGPVKGNTPLVRVPLLPAAEIAALEEQEARNKARTVELTREVSVLGEREYRAYIERQVVTDTERYLLAAWEFTHPAAGQSPPELASFCETHKILPAVFRRWVDYFDDKLPHPALQTLQHSTTRDAAVVESRSLAARIISAADARRQLINGDEVSKTLAESLRISLRADDRRLAINHEQQITYVPNRGHSPADAIPVADVSGPSLETIPLDGGKTQILHFAGNQLLQVAGSVPPTGSLFVVFRPDPAGGAGQRLIGWEDASAGQHGLGVMTDGAGAVHLVLRRNGASGDIVADAPSATPESPAFQILAVQWGPHGVAAHRQGVLIGKNTGLSSVSSDAAITSLRIGGPGSGSSPRFMGNVAELRVYDQPLSDVARKRIETELMERWCRNPGPPVDADPVSDFYAELISPQSPWRVDGPERDRVLPEDFQPRLVAVRAELELLQKRPAVVIPQTVSVQDGGPPGTPHEGFKDAAVYLRGNHAKPGQVVSRGMPKVIAGNNPAIIREGSGRLELARWLASPDNPLTARVIVNRVWQHHFGVGLVPSSANFGEMGDRPSHPELLDHLAAQFVANGWSIKHLHRLMMASRVYQQSSAANAAGLEADPENRLLWRANRRKLTAEELRDSLFTVASRLDPQQGGAGFQDIANPRRTLYLMSVRTGTKSAEFGGLFDAADCTGIVERRTESIVAPQALFFMNDPLVTELARLLGNRVLREVPAGSVDDRITRLYAIAFCRKPDESELQIGRDLLRGQPESSAWVGYCRVLFSTNEFLFVD